MANSVDIKLLKQFAPFGTMISDADEELMKRLNISQQELCDRLRRLADQGYLRGRGIFIGTVMTYDITPRGEQLLRDVDS